MLPGIYRKYLREIKRLPVPYLQQFFRIKVSDEIWRLKQCNDPVVRDSKIKKLSKDAQKLEAANHGNTKAMAHVLDLAYGRKGKLKREILKPLLNDARGRGEPLIKAVPTSYLPHYTPELRALLTASFSRSSKPSKPKDLDHPPLLPSRAAENSREIAMLGSFSKRREYNIRWRHFATQWKKVWPPLTLAIQELDAMTSQDLSNASIPCTSNQGRGLFRSIDDVLGPLPNSASGGGPGAGYIRHPSRWLRRRYLQLLFSIPLLVQRQAMDDRPPFIVPSVTRRHTLKAITADEESWLVSASNHASNTRDIKK